MYCKPCQRQVDRDYYAANTHRVRQRTTAYRQGVHGALRGYLVAHPCVDCGEADPVVLEFDHRNPVEKSRAVSDLIHSRTSWARLLAEIEKCDVRCANCHRRRTAVQFGSYRAGMHEGSVSL